MFKKILIGLLILLCLFLCWWYLLDNNRNFYKISKKEYSIPGLNTSFSSQGLCNINDTILISGYMSNGSPSRIYVIKNNKTKYYTLKYKGEDFKGHTGGIASDGINVWIASDKKVYNFSYDKLTSSKDYIELEHVFNPKNGADFLTIDNGNLWVGEFYLKNIYKTDSSHHIKDNYALSFRYKINSDKETGVEKIPDMALSLRSQVQGMIMTDDRIVISTSYGLPKSHIYYYKNITKEFTNDTFKYGDELVPLFILDDDNLVKTIETPSMSEEIELINNRVYINYENATKKYKLFTRERLKNIYSIPMY